MNDFMSPPGVVETHSAWVIFLGDRAYKLKKPVKLDFLDFSERSEREAAAHREVELNRRLAPDVYLGVVDIVGPEGSVCDHLVVMLRLPEARRLSGLVRAGVPLGGEIREIARVMAAFHARTPTSSEIAAVGQPEAVRDKVERDLEEMRAFAGELLDGPTLDEVTALVRQYLAGRVHLLETRIAAGCVRDGHGDLRADDIFCLDDGPRILDCIEFDDRLRYGDVLADIAFLAMDLEHLGAPSLAAQFTDSYREFTNEHHPTTLAHYYIAFRALIRSKVACVRAMQGDVDARNDAKVMLILARQHLLRARVRLVLVGGAPGTGKSTVATGVADHLGWSVLRSDEVRKDIVGLGHATRAEAAFGEGIYDAATTEATYEALLDRARIALQLGESVILDASWSRRSWREAAARTARDTASEFFELRCDAPAEVAAQRVLKRLAHGTDASDATTAVANSMRAMFDPWPSSRSIHTETSIERSLRAALDALDQDEA